MKTRHAARQVVLALLAFAGLLLGLEGVERVRSPYACFRNLMNSRGYRSPEFDPRKAPGTYRIVFIGGSTTSGVEGPPETTYPYLAERLLTPSPFGRAVQVINAAAPAKDSYWLAGRMTQVLALDPDLVMIMIGENDAASIYMNFADIAARGDLKLRPRWPLWLASRSALFALLRTTLTEWRYGPPGAPFRDSLPPEKRAAQSATWLREYPRHFEANIEGAIRLAAAHRVRLAFIEPPISRKRRVNRAAYAAAHDRLTAVLAATARRAGVPLLRLGDFYGDIEESFPEDWDGIHLPPAARKKMAERIAAYLRSERSRF